MGRRERQAGHASNHPKPEQGSDQRLLRVLLEPGGCLGWFDRLFPLRPSNRTDHAILLVLLEGVQKAQGLIDIASDGQVVDLNSLDNAFGINQEETAHRYSGCFLKHAVIGAHLFSKVREQGVFASLDSALLARGL